MELTFCSSDSSPGHYNSVWPVVWRDMKFRSMAMCWFFNRKSLQSCAGKLSLKFSVCPVGISECCWWSHWCAVLCVCVKNIYLWSPTSWWISFLCEVSQVTLVTAPVDLGGVCSPATGWWPWANHLPSAVGKNPNFLSEFYWGKYIMRVRKWW